MTGQRKAKDLIGARFGRLVVTDRAANVAEASGAIRSAWACKCDCGESTVVVAHSLVRGRSRSCGCLLKEKPVKHGQSRTKTYKAWVQMHQRCSNPKSTSFANYGGRGITVCERWREFSNFLADMGEPESGMTIDRIDNEVGYLPGNCQWATKREQSANRRISKTLTYQGVTLVYAEWGRITGLGRKVSWRARAGWPVERILTEHPSLLKPT